jgi:hypothetical protein
MTTSRSSFALLPTRRPRSARASRPPGPSRTVTRKAGAGPGRKPLAGLRGWPASAWIAGTGSVRGRHSCGRRATTRRPSSSCRTAIRADRPHSLPGADAAGAGSCTAMTQRHYVISRPDVDAGRIALIAFSMGGYSGPRAVAFEKRIAACIADCLLPDVYTPVVGRRHTPFAPVIFAGQRHDRTVAVERRTATARSRRTGRYSLRPSHLMDPPGLRGSVRPGAARPAFG